MYFFPYCIALIEQMCDDDLVSDMFYQFEIRNCQADDHPNIQNDEFSDDCLNTEDMLRSLGALYVPAFDVEANIATSQNNICFPMSTNVKSMSINKITKNKHYLLCVFEGRKISRRVSFCVNHGLFLCTKACKDP